MIVRNIKNIQIKYNKSFIYSKITIKTKANNKILLAKKFYSDFKRDEFIPLQEFNPSSEITKYYKKYININVEKSILKKEYENKLSYISEKSGNENLNKITLSKGSKYFIH